jgi:hypothetical protein
MAHKLKELWVSFLTMALCVIMGCDDPQNIRSQEQWGGSRFDTGDNILDDTDAVLEMPMAIASPPPTYPLPYVSGETFVPSTYSEPWHTNAIDFNFPNGANDCGQPVVAVAAGWVTVDGLSCPEIGSYSSTCGGGYGRHVWVDHVNDGYKSLNGHFNLVYVRSGQWVEQGQMLGTIGTSGKSTGCHLHYELRDRYSNVRVPVPFKFKASTGTVSSGTLTMGQRYTSLNHAKFDAMRNQLGSSNVGNMSPSGSGTTASRVHSRGWSLEYRGGSFGDSTMYYEVFGCSGGHGCPSYNNTNYAWLVRGSIRSKYFSIGGPNHRIGFPTGNQYGWNGGFRQDFRCGYISYDAWSVYTPKVTEYFYCPQGGQ